MLVLPVGAGMVISPPIAKCAVVYTKLSLRRNLVQLGRKELFQPVDGEQLRLITLTGSAALDTADANSSFDLIKLLRQGRFRVLLIFHLVDTFNATLGGLRHERREISLRVVLFHLGFLRLLREISDQRLNELSDVVAPAHFSRAWRCKARQRDQLATPAHDRLSVLACPTWEHRNCSTCSWRA